jgi:hypothetical protein
MGGTTIARANINRLDIGERPSLAFLRRLGAGRG